MSTMVDPRTPDTAQDRKDTTDAATNPSEQPTPLETSSSNSSSSSARPALALDAMTRSTLIANLRGVTELIRRASMARSPVALAAKESSAAPNLTRQQEDERLPPPVRLVAVSKFHPASAIAALAERSTSTSTGHTKQPQPLPQQHFGENYVQDLISKAQELHHRPGLAKLKWHFIGGLQSNKCAKLVRETPDLWAVESVDSRKKASLLDKASAERLAAEASNSCSNNGNDDEEPTASTANDDDADHRLRVYVQVNTSDEEAKSGCTPDEALDLAAFIERECAALRLQGFMTIGSLDQSKAAGEGAENPEFLRLRQVRDSAVEKLEVHERKLELSMGMSEDFVGAIAAGSDQVRVGSKIFGARPSSNPLKS